jgi:hypothetical protein
MRRFLRLLAVVAGGLLVSACDQPGHGGKKADGAWLGDLEAAKKESAATKKPILMDFSAEW